jgi:hypothetical protein
MAEHTDSELALLGILATGFESRQQQTNGLHIGEEAGRKAHEESLELQQKVLLNTGDTGSAAQAEADAPA